MKRISLSPVFDYELTTATDASFRRFKLCSALMRANAYKFRGIPAATVLLDEVTSLLAERIINSMVTKLTDKNRVNVFIFRG